MEPLQLDDEGRWWRLGDLEVDTRAEAAHGARRFVRTAVLAFRDQTTAEDGDVAEVLLWTVEAHPPLEDGCRACRTDDECPSQAAADLVALEWLARQVRDRSRRIASPEWQARLRKLEGRSA